MNIKELKKEEKDLDLEIEKLDDFEYGLKELVQGIIIGIIIGFALAYFLIRR